MASGHKWHGKRHLIYQFLIYQFIYQASLYTQGPRLTAAELAEEGCAQRLKPSSLSNATEKRNAMLRRTHLGKLVMISKSPPVRPEPVEGGTAVFQHPLDASEFKPGCSLFFH